MFQLCCMIGQEPMVHAQLLRVDTTKHVHCILEFLHSECNQRTALFVLMAEAKFLERLVTAVWKLTSGISYEALDQTALLATVGLSKLMLAMAMGVAWEQ